MHLLVGINISATAKIKHKNLKYNYLLMSAIPYFPKIRIASSILEVKNTPIGMQLDEVLCVKTMIFQSTSGYKHNIIYRKLIRTNKGNGIFFGFGHISLDLLSVDCFGYCFLLPTT